MSTVNMQAIWGLSGLQAGGEIMIAGRGNRSVSRGDTNFVAYKQGSLLRRAMGSALFALNNNNSIPLSQGYQKWTARVIGYSLPLVVQVLREYSKDYSLLHRSLTTVRESLPAITLIIDVCANLCLAYYVTPVFGVCMLGRLSIEVLKDTKILSPKINAIWEKVAIGITFVHAIGAPFIGEMDPIDAFLVAIELIIHVYEHYFVHNPPDPRHRLTFDQAEAYIALSELDFEVNTEHLGFNPKLGIKVPRDFEIVKTMKHLLILVNKNWTPARLALLKNRLVTDPLFLKDESFFRQFEAYRKYQNATIKNTEQLSNDTLVKDWFAHCANKLAWQVANRSIELGNQELHYDTIQDQLKSILAVLDERANQKALLEGEVKGRFSQSIKSEVMENDFENDLMDIALLGGNSCAGGLIQVIEQVFNKVIFGRKETPLQHSLIYKLGAMRDRWYGCFKQKLMESSNNILKIKGLFSPEDVHFDNILHFYPDAIFHTNSSAVRNDMTVEDFACDHLWQFIITHTIGDHIFWPHAMESDEWYSPKSILDELQDVNQDSPAMRTNLEKLGVWWNSWLEEQVKDTAEREDLLDKLQMEGLIFARPVTIPHHSSTKQKPLQMPNRELLRIMLVDMGILKVKDNVKARLESERLS